EQREAGPSRGAGPAHGAPRSTSAGRAHEGPRPRERYRRMAVMAWNLFRWIRWLARGQERRPRKRKYPPSARPKHVQPGFDPLEIRWMPAVLSGITECTFPTTPP